MPEYVGAIHLHSCYSDGSGTVREIAAAGCRAGLDFLILTDHDTLRPRDDGWQGWHDGVLVIVGVEITCPRRSHVVVLDAKLVAGLRFKPLRRLLFDLQNQGATAFVAHAHPASIMGYSMKAGELLDWEVPGFTGVELWSLMHDICNGLTPWRAPAFLRNWHRYVRGPHPDTLNHWDRITQDRQFPAVGSLDNHAINLPVIGRQVLPYEECFRTLTTHVLAEELDGGPADVDRILSAIVRGRAFIAMDLWASARQFSFEAFPGGDVAPLILGDEAAWTGPMTLRVRSPAAARLTLLCNGKPVAETEGALLEWRADRPGVYRVQAYHQGRPWVFTNPIYLRDAVDAARTQGEHGYGSR
jgi:hypothetical protein